jgi:chemotaxis protein methyltransferase CheR
MEYVDIHRNSLQYGTDEILHCARLADEIACRFGFSMGPQQTNRLIEFTNQLPVGRRLPLPAYVDMLCRQPNHPDWGNLMDFLTVRESYFFRNSAQFETLQKIIIPEWLLSKGAKYSGRQDRIRVLSAGCADGQEPYSVAMTWLDSVKYPKGWDFAIDAIDVSWSAIENAKTGHFASVRTESPVDFNRYLTRYFNGVPGDYHVNEEIRKLVRFGCANLKELVGTLNQKYDLILCRNVMIYFNSDDQQHLVRWLQNSLEGGGFLMLGDAETLHPFEHNLETVENVECLVYRLP